MATDLFMPLKLGPYTLRNRIVYAPMTRNRAEFDETPGKKWVKEYYEQRASAGMIVSEATQVGTGGRGYPLTPGIEKPEHIAAWKEIIDAVHSKRGLFFLQLWWCGRASHSSYQPDGLPPFAPSPVKCEYGDGNLYTYAGPQPYETPRELTKEGITEIIGFFKRGAENAKTAGADGVELHGANGYLIDQFIRDGTNKRTDEYGGSAENRCRFLMELIDACVEVFGADKVGVRLSPGGTYLDCLDSDHLGTFTTAVKMISAKKIAYLHIIESCATDLRHGGELLPVKLFRPHYAGLIITNTEYTKERGNAVIAAGDADAVSFGRAFLANPDLPRRFLEDAPLNEPDPSSFYGGTDKGFIDYPSLDDAVATAVAPTAAAGEQTEEA